jgi:hypothetical protein
VALQLPVAYANRAGWSYFFTFNRDRPAQDGLWVLLRHLSTPEVNRLGLIAMVLGGGALALLAARASRAVLFPLGAGLLLWWLFLNKVFSPQYALWVFFALALLRPAWSLWVGFVAVDLGHFSVSFLIVFSQRLGSDLLVDWEARHMFVPVQLLREVLLAIFVAGAIRLLLRPHPVVVAGRSCAAR